jgi:DNA-binding MarR family transcriptional regulator
MPKQLDTVDVLVAQWGRERPDLDTTAMAVFARVYRLARLAAERVEAVYGPYGIGRPEFDVLATLRRSGSPYELSPGALSAAMLLSTGGTTARLDRLEAAGLVRRSPDPHDRRAVLVRLTPEGCSLVEGALEAGLACQQDMLAHLSHSRQAQLSGLLREVLVPLEP